MASLSGFDWNTIPKTTTPNVSGALGTGLKAAGGLLGSLIKPPATSQAQSLQGAFAKSFPTLSSTGYASAAPMGVQAKAPEQQISKPSTSLTSSQMNSLGPITVPQLLPQKNTLQTPYSNPNANIQTPGSMGNTVAQQPVYSQSGGAIIPQYTPQDNTQQQSTQQQSDTQSGAQNGTPSPYEPNAGLYGQLIAALANRGTQQNPMTDEAMKSLLNLAQNGTPEYNQAIQNLQDLNKNYADQTFNIKNAGTDLSLQTGQQQNLSQQYAGREAAAQQAVSQQQAQQGQLLGALYNVGGLGNTQQGLLQQALQQAAAGAAPTVMSKDQYLMSTLGGGATDAAQGQAQGFAAGSRSAVADQNNAQATQHQANADAISGKLQQLVPTVDKLTSYMQKYSYNGQPLPILNQQINTINQQTEPDLYGTVQASIGDIVANTQQILQAQGGMTDTQAGGIVSSWAQNMQNMTPLALASFAKNIETLGQIRLSEEQAQAKVARDANQTGGGAPAQGMDANTSAEFQRATESALNNLPDWAKAGAGVIANYGGAIAQSAAGAAEGAAVGGLPGAAVGAVAPGLAKSFFAAI